jgi:hypothetical protein
MQTKLYLFIRVCVSQIHVGFILIFQPEADQPLVDILIYIEQWMAVRLSLSFIQMTKTIMTKFNELKV